MKQKNKIGIVSSGWGEMGVCLVNRTFYQAMSKEHEVYVFATQNPRGDTLMQTREGLWDLPNVFFADYPYQQLGRYIDELDSWVEKNNIGTLFFNEMFLFELVQRYKQQGLKVIAYLDYFSERWLEHLKVYDLVFVATKQKYNLFKNDYSNIKYVPWGVDTNLFAPRSGDKATFFHSAGWGGYNWRKQTPLVVQTWYDLKDEGFTYFLHTQIKQYPQNTAMQIRELVERKQLDFYAGSVSWPGLYHKGKIHVCPTKLEGLGLFVPEGLSVGLPTITTNYPPMNEFVKDGHNGFVIDVETEQRRQDYGGSYYFPECHIKESDLKAKMLKLGHDEQ